MDINDLVAQPCTVAGCIMEDVSVIALAHDDDVDARTAAIEEAGRDTAALAAAAEHYVGVLSYVRNWPLAVRPLSGALREKRTSPLQRSARSQLAVSSLAAFE